MLLMTQELYAKVCNKLPGFISCVNWCNNFSSEWDIQYDKFCSFFDNFGIITVFCLWCWCWIHDLCEDTGAYTLVFATNLSGFVWCVNYCNFPVPVQHGHETDLLQAHSHETGLAWQLLLHCVVQEVPWSGAVTLWQGTLMHLSSISCFWDVCCSLFSSIISSVFMM